MGDLSIGYVLGSTAGGTGRHVAMLAGGCVAAGLAVTVYGPAATAGRFFPPPGAGGAGAGAGDAWAGAGFIPAEIAGRPHPARDVACVLRLRRLLAGARHDVIHAHGMRAGAFAVAALARLAERPPVLVTVHNAAPEGGLDALVHAVLARAVARGAAEVACVSSDLAGQMRRLGARDGGLAQVPAPLPPPPGRAAVAAVRAELGAQRRPLVVSAGRLAPQKGFATLLEAAVRWQHHDPAPLVAIAGDGPLAQPLRAQAARTGLDVRFLGQRDDVPVLLAAADVVAVPSRWEGQPLLVQEALWAGRPVVATRTGGIPALTGEDGALLVPPGDAARLARAVLSVLGDPGLAAGLATAARARAARLPTVAGAVATAMRSYERLAAGRAGSPRPAGRAIRRAGGGAGPRGR